MPHDQYGDQQADAGCVFSLADPPDPWLVSQRTASQMKTSKARVPTMDAGSNSLFALPSSPLWKTAVKPQ
jgi:hypothetical protein